MQSARAQRSVRPLLFVALSAICLVFAYHRSFWADEIVRMKQSGLSLELALRSLFAEPSPFSPGEIVLNWISRGIFGTILPAEIWARIPGTLWVLGTFWVSLEIGRQKIFRYLPWFVFFSVSLLTVSVQMRPYGSLIFAGAIAADLILKNEGQLPSRKRWQDTLTWIALVFGHIYGICLIALACLLTQRLVRGIFGLIYAAGILALCTIHVTQPGPIPGLPKLITIIIFAIGNPHHASFILAPLALLGAWALYRCDSQKCLKLLAILLIGTIAPVVIDLSYRYFFAPRQVLAGILPFLILCAAGLELSVRKIPSALARRSVVTVIFAATLFVPWILSVIYKMPPVTDQPMHRFRELTESFANSHLHSVLLLDPCNLGTLDYYLEPLFKGAPLPIHHVTQDGIQFQQLCWKSAGFCVTAPVELKYCWMKENQFAKDPMSGFISAHASQFDRIVYELPYFPALRGVGRGEAVRAW